MADITLGYALTPGQVAQALGFSQNFYAPGTPASSFAELNGLVEKSNCDSGTWVVRAPQVRDRSMVGGRMVGSTMNVDYLSSLCPALDTETGAYTPIGGCGIAFFLPVSPRVTWITWQLPTSADSGSTTGANIQFKFRVDGTTVVNQKRQQPVTTYATGKWRKRDRVWSGAWMAPPSSPLAAGWHTATLLYWGGAFNRGGNPVDPLVRSGMCRTRIKNIKVFWLA